MSRLQSCPKCKGKGGWTSESYLDGGHIMRDRDGEWIPCETCDETGYVPEEAS